MIPPVLSQKGYPGVGDIDDCWVVATIWAAVASRLSIKRPTITAFRAAGDRPDRPNKPDGGNISNVYAAAKATLAAAKPELFKSTSWTTFMRKLKAGQPASVGLHSAYLPERHRYGFLGTHQCGVIWDGDEILLMNPLAKDGAPLKPITEAELKRAMWNLLKGTGARLQYRAVFFDEPPPAERWGNAVPVEIRKAFTALAVAKKLVAVGVRNWGASIDLSDIAAGLRKRRIDYGTSVQLIDVQALMKPGTGR